MTGGKWSEMALWITQDQVHGKGVFFEVNKRQQCWGYETVLLPHQRTVESEPKACDSCCHELGNRLSGFLEEE